MSTHYLITRSIVHTTTYKVRADNAQDALAYFDDEDRLGCGAYTGDVHTVKHTTKNRYAYAKPVDTEYVAPDKGCWCCGSTDAPSPGTCACPDCGTI
jgi:hypothetical protein